MYGYQAHWGSNGLGVFATSATTSVREDKMLLGVKNLTVSPIKQDLSGMVLVQNAEHREEEP